MLFAMEISGFDKKDLRYWYNKGRCKAIKMTYNGALRKRIVRHDLIEEIGLDRDSYWGFFKLNDSQFFEIARRGSVMHLLKR